MKKIKLKKSQLIIYFAIFILFLVLNNARGVLVSAFGFGALFALMWTGFFVPIISVEYLLANLILANKIADVYCALFTIFILVLTYCIHKKLKKPMNVCLVGTYALLSQIITIYYIYCLGSWVDITLFMLLGEIFLYCCICVFQVFVLRGWCYKLTLDELICLIVFIVVCSFGVAEACVFNIELYKFIAVLFMLLCVGVGKNAFSVIGIVAIGVGVSIVSSSLAVVGELAIIGLIANIYNYPHRYKIAFCALLGDLAIQLYFIGWQYSIIYNLFPTLLAVSVFLIVPNRVYEKLTSKYEIAENELSVRNVINSTRKNLKRRMGELSDIFAQMKSIQLQLINKDITSGQVSSMFCADLQHSICGDCKHKSFCYKNLGYDKACINQLVDLGLKKGKISTLDIPSGMAQKCNISNLIIGRINQSIMQYKKYDGMVQDVNNVKYLLAEQMGAVSRLLLDLGEELDKNITFEKGLETKIMNKLLAQNIICNEVLLYNECKQDIMAVVIVKGDNAYNPIIEKIVGDVLNISMRVDCVEPTDIKDYYSVSLFRNCKRDVAFGISCITKSGSVSSGDSHSLIRLGSNKYLLALCDGMGSGESARKMSALAIGLVENFYRAGFEDSFIYDSINKLLAISNQENFSTLDLCVIDLTKEVLDFIKIGAPYGVLKRDKYVEKVENGTIPLGVLKNINPSISHFAVTNKDMIIMMTDGVTDAFEDYESLAQFINSISITNPQAVTQIILDEAIKRNNMQALDDMTVLAARTFLKD